MVNKATGQALKHSVGAHHPVQLIPYVPDILDESVLWTLSEDLGDGYRAMRMATNAHLNVDAFQDSNGCVHDGTSIGLWEWLQGENQRWKIVQLQDGPSSIYDQMHQVQLQDGPSSIYVQTHQVQLQDGPSSIYDQTHQVWDYLGQMPSVRVYTKAETNCSLAIRHGKVILAQADPSDPSQHWVKDEKYSTEVKDQHGFSSFALVNKATLQGMKHSIEAHHPVQLVPYVPGTLDESVLWTLSEDLGDGYRAMRMASNTRLSVDAFKNSKGRIHDGTIIGLWEWKKGENQRWKIVPHEYVPSSIHNHTHQVWDCLSRMPSVRVCTKAEANCSLAVRHGKVILARADPSDPSQHWVKDEKYSTEVKDQNGFPSFSLVNKATGQIMKHSVGATHPVQLIPYSPDKLDESVLWTLGADMGDGYRSMRMVNNTRLNLDAFLNSDGRVDDGTTIGLWEWSKGENQQWKIIPY
ncbi:ricin B-like lectin R40G2 isoform X2 [Apium graveolens]